MSRQSYFPSIVTSVNARKFLWRKFLEYILVLIILLLIVSFPLETWPCLRSTGSGSQNFSKKPMSKEPSELLFLSESFGDQVRNSLVQNLACSRQWVHWFFDSPRGPLREWHSCKVLATYTLWLAYEIRVIMVEKVKRKTLKWLLPQPRNAIKTVFWQGGDMMDRGD